MKPPRPRPRPAGAWAIAVASNAARTTSQTRFAKILDGRVIRILPSRNDPDVIGYSCDCTRSVARSRERLKQLKCLYRRGIRLCSLILTMDHVTAWNTRPLPVGDLRWRLPL